MNILDKLMTSFKVKLGVMFQKDHLGQLRLDNMDDNQLRSENDQSRPLIMQLSQAKTSYWLSYQVIGHFRLANKQLRTDNNQLRLAKDHLRPTNNQH